jgi:predicted CXXCH cytochrome family protein
MPCHRAECDVYSGTHHLHTLHILDPGRPTEVDPPRGAIPRTGFSVDTFAGDYVVTRATDMSRMQPLVFAFGSGKIGITYASPNGPDSLIEIHKTWFPHDRRWATTLGQETLKADVVGRNRTDGRQCLLCHTVTLPAGALQPEPKFLGVGCESCHGPAGAHVDAMRVNAVRARAGDSALERLSQWDATRINTLCGRCHGTQATILSKRDQQLTYRFQPIGLMSSRCFLAGGRSLSCTTCHDPHTDAVPTANHYEAICLRCHAASANKSTNRSNRVATAAQANVACPINPRNGCIGCHMPDRKAVPNSDITYRMADHRIAVYRADTKPSRR